MMKNVSVSIISANYNNAEFLKEFFDSILNSSLLPAQVCLVDDCSSDNSKQVIKNYEKTFIEKGIKFDVQYLNENVGFGNALNLAISMASEKYSLRIDPDDKMYPNRIKVQYDYLENNAEICGVGSNIDYFLSESSEVIRKSNVTTCNDEMLSLLKLGCIPVIHGSLMIRTDIFRYFAYVQELVPAEDYHLFSRLLSSGFRIDNTPEVLTSVRVHEGSVSNSLPYSTIKKTYEIRETVWGVPFSSVTCYRRFYSMSNYRKYLFDTSFTRYGKLLLASLFWPESVVRYIKGIINENKRNN